MKTITALSFVSLALLMAGLSPQPAWAGFGVETKLTAFDAAMADFFGNSVAISGNTAIVGARQNDDAGTSSGSAYLFDVTTGNQLFKLVASDAAAGAGFGTAVAISGNTAIAGGPSSAYLFDVTSGNELFKLTASDLAAGDLFGGSVAISSSTAIVGAIVDEGGGGNPGSAYLFDVTTGDELFKLTASDAAADDFFGVSVAISGNTAIVGAPRNDDTASDSGSAYLFDATTGTELFKLTASDAMFSDQFGISVAISGNTAIVGAVGIGDRSAGRAYLFDITTGDELFKLTASDAAFADLFGTSVAISAGTALIGAPLNDDASTSSGSAYLFDATTGMQLQKLTASDAAGFNEFGKSVAISGSTAIVGALGTRVEGRAAAGSAYLFTPEPSSFLLAALAGLFGLGAAHRRRRK